MTDSSLVFELGAIMLVAFAGAAIATRSKQSVILAYIVVGIFIGPYIHIQIGSFVYNGLIQDLDTVNMLSQIGLVLLMFFVGLDFSMEKIRKVKGPALLLSIIGVGVNLFTGFLLAACLGWPLIDSIFLAAILSMSCTAVAMKSLMDLGRLSNPETDYILGMIIMEEFISMILLGVVDGLVMDASSSISIFNMMLGMVAFIVFFVIMAMVVIPRTISYIQHMKSDELFILFMLGAIFLSAEVAELCGVPMLIGAFFIGMTFAETKVMARVEKKVTPLKDAFVAIFFVAFGMLINPSMIYPILGIVAIAIVLIIVDEMLIMSMVAYLVGFPRRVATSIGASFTARGGESLMYASLASESPNVTKGAQIYPIAGSSRSL